MNAPEKSRYCAFCGLPIPRSLSLSAGSSPDVEVDYCCSGCRVVSNVQQSESEQGGSAKNLMRLGLAIFFTMNVMVFSMALWSQDFYPEQAFESELSDVLRGVFRWASFVFSMPVLWLLGGPIAQGVRQSLSRGAITTDLLILLGVTSAYGYSIISVIRGAGHVYFEVGSMVLVFVSLGRWLEAKGKRRTGESLDQLADLLPATVRRADRQGSFRELPRAQVVTGDVLRVLPGERFPVDGRIVVGRANVDQQMVTGESLPAEKTVGDDVYSGTLNLDGDLQLEVTAADGRETVSRLIEMVRAARSVKGRQEQLADRIATWFVPFVCIIAVAAGWYQGQTQGFDQGILTGLAVVLIACPCALGLATPMAVWTALGRAAECGVLFRSGMVMQKLAEVKIACFDKTGTITEGKPSVACLLVANHQPADPVLEIASAITAGSNHPLSQAISDYAHQRLREVPIRGATTVEMFSGMGLGCELPGYGKVLVGSRRLMKEAALNWPVDLAEELEELETTQQVFIGWQGRVRAVFCFSEALRSEAADALASCQQLGLELHLLTGDSPARAEAIGKQLTVPAQSNQLPNDKVTTIESLAAQGSVAMVGEGLNDAPALAAADVGVALGCGADVSRDAAGVCLLADDLRRFPWAVGLARQTSRVVKQNLFWAFTYNCLGIALAATGRLNPIWAALAMAVSSLWVVTNSLRLSSYSEPLPSTQKVSVPKMTDSREVRNASKNALPLTSELAATSS